MQQRRFPVFLVAIVAIVFLFLGGSMVYQQGWSQGFLLGQLASGQDGVLLPQMVNGGSSSPGFFLSMLACLTFGFFAFAALMVFKGFRHRHWAMAKGEQPEKWSGWADHWAEHWQTKPGAAESSEKSAPIQEQAPPQPAPSAAPAPEQEILDDDTT